jgi:hypothetical protein
MSDNLFNQSENMYLSILVKEDERILWNGHPGSMDIKKKTRPIIVGIFLVFTFDPSKPNDTQFMRITFIAENQRIRSYELTRGELISKVSPETKIEFKVIEDWFKMRQILSDFVPNAIQEKEKL